MNPEIASGSVMMLEVAEPLLLFDTEASVLVSTRAELVVFSEATLKKSGAPVN